MPCSHICFSKNRSYLLSTVGIFMNTQDIYTFPLRFSQWYEFLLSCVFAALGLMTAYFILIEVSAVSFASRIYTDFIFVCFLCQTFILFIFYSCVLHWLQKQQQQKKVFSRRCFFFCNTEVYEVEGAIENVLKSILPIFLSITHCLTFVPFFLFKMFTINKPKLETSNVCFVQCIYEKYTSV